MFMSPGVNKTLKVSSLSVGSTSKLDVADNKVVVSGGTVGTSNGTTYSGLTGLIQAAHNAGSWDGVNGITTSMPDAATGLTSLGIATADETGYAGGTFGGVSVAAGDVLVMYTYGGDANLDGVVDIDDYGQIDAGFRQQRKGFFNGDFNLDGVVDIDDYGIIDPSFRQQGPPL